MPAAARRGFDRRQTAGRGSVLLLLAVRAELLEIGPQIAGLLLVLDAGEDHLGIGDLGARILDVIFESRLAPDDAGILVGLGIAVAGDVAGMAAIEAVELGADQVLGALADAVAGQAFLEG